MHVVSDTVFSLSTYGKIHLISRSLHTATLAGWPGASHLPTTTCPSPQLRAAPRIPPPPRPSPGARLPDPTSERLLPCPRPSQRPPTAPLVPWPGPVTCGSPDMPPAFLAGPPARRPLGLAPGRHLLRSFSYFTASGFLDRSGGGGRPGLVWVLASTTDMLPGLGQAACPLTASVSLPGKQDHVRDQGNIIYGVVPTVQAPSQAFHPHDLIFPSQLQCDVGNNCVPSTVPSTLCVFTHLLLKTVP